MSNIPTMVLVGADKGGVGKTFLSRALLDYLRAKALPHRAFDTEVLANGGVLKRFAPSAEMVDIATVPGQMQIFDAISSGAVTVVDIRAGQLTPTLRALASSGVMGDVRERKARLVLLHVLGSTVASMKEVADILAQMSGAEHILVRNKTNADASFREFEDSAKSLLTLDIPFLNETACETVDGLDISFLDFMADDANSRVLRGYVREWLDKVNLEFAKVRIA